MTAHARSERPCPVCVQPIVVGGEIAQCHAGWAHPACAQRARERRQQRMQAWGAARRAAAGVPLTARCTLCGNGFTEEEVARGQHMALLGEDGSAHPWCAGARERAALPGRTETPPS